MSFLKTVITSNVICLTQTEDLISLINQYFLGQKRFKLLQVLSKYDKLVPQVETVLYLYPNKAGLFEGSFFFWGGGEGGGEVILEKELI